MKYNLTTHRVQNKLVISFCKLEDEEECKEIFDYHEPKGWIAYKHKVINY